MTSRTFWCVVFSVFKWLRIRLFNLIIFRFTNTYDDIYRIRIHMIQFFLIHNIHKNITFCSVLLLNSKFQFYFILFQYFFKASVWAIKHTFRTNVICSKYKSNVLAIAIKVIPQNICAQIKYHKTSGQKINQYSCQSVALYICSRYMY